MSETATVPHLARMEGRKSPFEMAPTELLDRAAEYRRMKVDAQEPDREALVRIAEIYETMATARRVELGAPSVPSEDRERLKRTGPRLGSTLAPDKQGGNENDKRTTSPVGCERARHGRGSFRFSGSRHASTDR